MTLKKCYNTSSKDFGRQIWVALSQSTLIKAKLKATIDVILRPPNLDSKAGMKL